jgi:hypothetical protein
MIRPESFRFRAVVVSGVHRAVGTAWVWHSGQRFQWCRITPASFRSRPRSKRGVTCFPLDRPLPAFSIPLDLAPMGAAELRQRLARMRSKIHVTTKDVCL